MNGQLPSFGAELDTMARHHKLNIGEGARQQSVVRRCSSFIYSNIRRRRHAIWLLCGLALMAWMVKCMIQAVHMEPRPRRMPLGVQGQRDFALNRMGIPGEWRGTNAAWLTGPEGERCKGLIHSADAMPAVNFIHFDAVIDSVPLVGWEDKWISNGVFEPRFAPLPHRKVDFVYTWVNGTDPDFVALAKKHETRQDHLVGSNRVREWDELRYSVRAAFRNASPEKFGKIHLIVKELSTSGKDMDQYLQTPTWLDMDAEATRKYVRLVGESELYEQKECLPTFNSISIEAQLHRMSNITDDLIIAMSDDMLLGRPFSDDDLHSPLYGLPLNPYENNFFENTLEEPTLRSVRLSRGESTERPPARYTSWLLNERFGSKPRSLVKHLPKLIDMSILREAFATFPKAAMQTPQYRFRGGGLQVSAWMMSAWFTMDRHREALLWSYIHLRMDQDQDGCLSSKEQKKILAEIEYGRKHALSHPGVRNATLKYTSKSWKAAKLEPPQNHDVYWTSLDGPPSLMLLNATMCTTRFVKESCLYKSFGMTGTMQIPTAEVYNRLIRNQTCGDCLLLYLLSPHPVGLGPILPSAPAARVKAIKAIQRYQYFLTTPSFEFLMIQSYKSGVDVFNRTANAMPGFLCVNDDLNRIMGTFMLPRFKQMYRDFYERIMPGMSPVEKGYEK